VEDLKVNTVACVQTSSGPDPEANWKQAEQLTREAQARGAALVALPEVVDFLDEGTATFQRYARPLSEHAAAIRFGNLAAELRLWILVGSVTVRVDATRLANRTLLFNDSGEMVAHYDKIHLFDTGVVGKKASKESDTFAPGGRAVVVETPVGRLGLSICYDVRFPHLYRDLAKAGAEILAVPSNFLQITGAAHWHVLLRARAIETGAYVIAPAQCGECRPGNRSFGHSLIVDPWGDVLADAGPDRVGVIHATIDPGRIAQVREQIRSLSHDRPYRLAQVV
jgi:predicted amidohydrolase